MEAITVECIQRAIRREAPDRVVAADRDSGPLLVNMAWDGELQTMDTLSGSFAQEWFAHALRCEGRAMGFVCICRRSTRMVDAGLGLAIRRKAWNLNRRNSYIRMGDDQGVEHQLLL